MNEDIITDLKQFIVGVVTQQCAYTRQTVSGLEVKMDDSFSDIAEILEDMNTRHDAVEKDHERRIGLLEQKALHRAA